MDYQELLVRALLSAKACERLVSYASMSFSSGDKEWAFCRAESGLQEGKEEICRKEEEVAFGEENRKVLLNDVKILDRKVGGSTWREKNKMKKARERCNLNSSVGSGLYRL